MADQYIYHNYLSFHFWLTLNFRFNRLKGKQSSPVVLRRMRFVQCSNNVLSKQLELKISSKDTDIIDHFHERL